MAHHFQILEQVSSDIYHLSQDDVNFSQSKAFAGSISKEPIVHNGRKYQVIDEAIAVKARAISAFAEKSLYVTGSVLSAGAGVAGVACAISFGVASGAGIAGVVAGVVVGSLSSYLFYRAYKNVDNDDANHVAHMRKMHNPNQSTLAFSSAYNASNKSVDQAKKYFTQKELKYAFEKEFNFEDFSVITKRVPLSATKSFVDEKILRKKFAKEINRSWDGPQTFFNTYDRGNQVSLKQMHHMGILNASEWENVLNLKTDYDRILDSDSLQRASIKYRKEKEIQGITQTRNLKIDNAELIHDNNWGVIARNVVIARNILPRDRSTESSQATLLEAGLSLAAYLAAAAADQARDDAIIAAKVDFGVAEKHISERYSAEYESLNRETQNTINTLSTRFSALIVNLRDSLAA